MVVQKETGYLGEYSKQEEGNKYFIVGNSLKEVRRKHSKIGNLVVGGLELASRLICLGFEVTHRNSDLSAGGFLVSILGVMIY